MKIAITLQYNGEAFAGFQIQKVERTVQGELERALSVYFRTPIRVHGAGRTDTGVHAMGQVAHFSLDDVSESQREAVRGNLHRLIYSINCMTIEDVSIVYAEIVNDDFHARFSCRGREYVYRVLQSEYRMSLYLKTHHWVRKKLDLPAMEEAAAHLIGENDFAAFTRKIYQTSGEVTIRRIDEIQIIPRPPFLYFYYNGSGFLHNMIRILTGTLIRTGKGELTPLQVKEILDKKDRTEAGMTLPPNSLVFLNARYDDYETPRELIPLYEELFPEKFQVD